MGMAVADGPRAIFVGWRRPASKLSTARAISGSMACQPILAGLKALQAMTEMSVSAVAVVYRACGLWFEPSFTKRQGKRWVAIATFEYACRDQTREAP